MHHSDRDGHAALRGSAAPARLTPKPHRRPLRDVAALAFTLLAMAAFIGWLAH